MFLPALTGTAPRLGVQGREQTMNINLNRTAIRAILAASVLLTAISAHAANVYSMDINNPGHSAIAIDGDIVAGDADKFEQVASGMQGQTSVLLDSPGGKVVEGLRIAQSIHDRHFNTR
jgi:hypothetical protein